MNTRKHLLRKALVALPLYAVLSSSAAFAQTSEPGDGPVDLLGFMDESYGSVQPLLDVPAGWSRIGDFAVLQAANGNPTMAYSDFDVMDQRITFNVQVSNVHENDFFGVAVGYQEGDVANAQADYLLIDWKRIAEAPNPSFFVQGGVEGLRLSQVTGVPDLIEFFDHSSLDAAPFSPDSGVTELAAGATLGQLGWAPLTVYTFELEVRADSLKVFIDGQLEIDYVGPVPLGRMAFYNASQPGTRYDNLRIEPLPAQPQREHLVFVTSKTYTSDLGGLAGADAKCQERADRARLPGHFRAILSDSMMDAAERISINGPVVDRDGNLIAADEAGLWSGSLLAPIRINDVKGVTAGFTWTGTDTDGTARDRGFDFCGDWTVDGVLNSSAETGRIGNTDGGWVRRAGTSALACSNHLNLYCIDSDI